VRGLCQRDLGWGILVVPFATKRTVPVEMAGPKSIWRGVERIGGRYGRGGNG
jgi:hypothetical protein